jgi:hypothetical protein
LGRATEFGDPLDDDVDIDDGAIVGSSALDVPEDSALPAIDVSGVVDPLVMAGGALGESGLSAKDTKINTMPKTAAVPIPFCKRRTSTTYLNSLGRLDFARSRSDISPLVPELPASVASGSEDLLGLAIHKPLTRVPTSIPTPVLEPSRPGVPERP